MVLKEFLNVNFVQPLLLADAPYNIYNTAVYAILLAVAVFGVYKLVKYLKIKIDTNFFVATLPFIFLAGVLRVLRDAEIYTTIWLVSPLIYILMFFITLGGLLVSIFLSKQSEKLPYHYTMTSIGIILLIIFGVQLSISNYFALGQILLFFALSTSGAFLLAYFIKHGLFTPINLFILAAAMFDAASTVVGVEYFGYLEKHVLPNYLFGLFGGAWVMFPLKFIVIAFALWAIDQTESDTFMANFIKFAILAVTLGPGSRNTLRIIMGT